MNLAVKAATPANEMQLWGLNTVIKYTITAPLLLVLIIIHVAENVMASFRAVLCLWGGGGG